MQNYQFCFTYVMASLCEAIFICCVHLAANLGGWPTLTRESGGQPLFLIFTRIT